MKTRAVSLDETSYYNLPPEDAAYIQEIRSSYVYNPDSCTHLCELTPSYELSYLHTYIVWKGEPSEDKREELMERYCDGDREDTYMHCSTVEKLTTKDCGEYDSMDDAREYLLGNWPF